MNTPTTTTLTLALLGAEGTGKSSLTIALAHHLRTHLPSHCTVVTVSEYLREWCVAHGRTPLAHEQVHIAHVQAQRMARVQQQQGPSDSVSYGIDAPPMQVLLADTTPLMTAIYSEYYFGDCSLYPMAWAQQAKCDAHLLMGLDLTWQADGHWRDGPPVQKAVDALLRERLQTAGLRYHTVYGQGQQRVAAAWTAIELLFLSKKSSKNRAINPINKSGRHDFYSKNLLECTECAHPESERALFSRLLQTRLTASPPPSASALVPAAVSAPMHLPPPQTLPPLT